MEPRSRALANEMKRLPDWTQAAISEIVLTRHFAASCLGPAPESAGCCGHGEENQPPYCVRICWVKLLVLN